MGVMRSAFPPDLTMTNIMDGPEWREERCILKSYLAISLINIVTAHTLEYAFYLDGLFIPPNARSPQAAHASRTRPLPEIRPPGATLGSPHFPQRSARPTSRSLPAH